MKAQKSTPVMLFSVFAQLILALFAATVYAEVAKDSPITALTTMKPRLVPMTETVTLALGLGNVFLVQTNDGNVVIDTGVAQQALLQRDLLLNKHPGKISHAAVTHAHGDHSGGVNLYTEQGAALVAHRRFAENMDYQARLAPIMARRNSVFWGGFSATPDSSGEHQWSAFPAPDVIVDDNLELEIGGRIFQFIHTPSESDDMITVWLPDERIAFSGDLYGNSFPNLYTLRGHYYRFPNNYIRSLDRLIALRPEILAPSHFQPIIGREKVFKALTGLREAIRYVHDETVRGMNQGKDLWTLMSEIKIPEHLPVDQSHGSVEWSVRAIWEGYLGWFRYDSTTEIYPLPPSAVHSDLVELAGGIDGLVSRAQLKVNAGKPVEALHLLDVCQSVEPGHKGAHKVRISALQLLLTKAGENFSRIAWLRHRINVSQKALEAE